ncbi:MAG: hypothetical protein ABI322_04535, partial [Gemmatimonadaceae bacterium]
FIDDVHSLYRIHANSLTRTAVEQTLLDGATVRLKYLAASKRKISHTRVRRARESIARSLNDVGYARWCADRRSGARQIYLQSWRLKPSVAAFAGFLKAYIRRDIALSVIRVVRRPKSELSRLR